MTTGELISLAVAVLGVLHGPLTPALVKWLKGRKVKS